MKILILLSFFLISFNIEAKETKIALINMDEIISNTNDYKKFNKKINTYIESQNFKINLLRQKEEKNKKILTLDLLSVSGKDSFHTKNQILKEKIHMIVRDSENYIREEEQKIKNKIIRRIIPIIKDYVKNKQFLVTVDITSIVYDNKTKFTDISNKISDIYNKKYKE